MSNENAVRNLIRVDDKQNPTLFRALQLLIDDLYKINNEVFPDTPAGSDQTGAGGVGVLGAVQNFTGTIYPDNLRLGWDTLQFAFRYQIKLGEDWDTARPVIVTASNVVNLDPLQFGFIYGEYTFIIRAMTTGGSLGAESRATLIVPQIGPPNLNVEAIVNTVLLKWTEPPSAWRIDHFNVFRDSIYIGSIKGTFKLIQEQVGGTYGYSVEAVDIVGNRSTMSAIKLIDLKDPSDYEFVAAIDAEYDGTYVRTAKVSHEGSTGVLGPVQGDETWAEHFENNGKTTIQEFVDAGFIYYYQPTFNGIGTYEEVFDFGSLYNNLIVIASFSKLQLSGITTVTTTISYSSDNIVYSAPVVGNSILGLNFRYVKVKYTFTNIDDLSAAFISNLQVILNVTLTIDSGTAQAFAADVGGTLVTYNKTYVGVNSVTATPAVSKQPLYAVTDQINKVNFRVLVFDSSGNRVDSPVNWKSRGVV